MMPPTSWSHQTSISRRVEIAMTMSNVPEDEEEAEHSRRRRKRVAWMDEGHDSGNDEDHGHGGVEQFPPTSGEDHDAEPRAHPPRLRRTRTDLGHKKTATTEIYIQRFNGDQADDKVREAMTG
jgi:hypothetical protein